MRHHVWRRALFFDGEADPQVGCVADVSSGGLRLEADAPAPVGAELDIEVHPSSGEWTGSLRMRGRVVRVSEQGAMGVRVIAGPVSKPSPAPSRIVYLPRRRSVLPPYALPAPHPAQHLWRRWFPAAALALVLLVWLPGWWHHEQPAPPKPAHALPATVELQTEDPQPAPDVPATASDKAGDGIRLVVDRSEGQLTLFRQSRPLRTFPVDFARGQTAPEDGFQFAVQTKPSSRKRANTQWLSLGHESVRIRSTDADTLLRFCPAGTPVSVRP